MSKFKANAYGLASSLSKALENVGSKQRPSTPSEQHDGGDPSGAGAGAQKMLNNKPSNESHSNYNYSPLTGHDPDRSSSSPTKSKWATDYTPRCMRPKSQSFQEVMMSETEPVEMMSLDINPAPVSPPVLTSSTNPFLQHQKSIESSSNTRPFIYNDLQQSRVEMQPKWPNREPNEYQELQEIRPSPKTKYLETNFESEPQQVEDKLNYKLNIGVPMVGMVSNAELVKINTQSPTPNSPSAQPLYPVAAIHPSKAVPLSSIFGLSIPNLPSSSAPQSKQEIIPNLADVNPNSKSTDIFWSKIHIR